MTDILEEIVAHKRREVERFRQAMPVDKLAVLTEKVLDTPVASMRTALLGSATGIIAEFKRKSPSRGWINREAGVADVTSAYQRAGAAALSILTDSFFFGGADEYVRQARSAGVGLPVLYKNFIVDEYQLFQARCCGASAVLLIASVLSVGECRRLMSLAHDLGMEVLLEMHGREELDYAELEPDMYGVNNRHLGTFVTDVGASFSLSSQLPAGGCLVSESGLSSPECIIRLRGAGYRGFLMGEHFMRSASPGETLYRLVEELNRMQSCNAAGKNM